MELSDELCILHYKAPLPRYWFSFYLRRVPSTKGVCGLCVCVCVVYYMYNFYPLTAGLRNWTDMLENGNGFEELLATTLQVKPRFVDSREVSLPSLSLKDFMCIKRGDVMNGKISIRW